MGLILTLGMVPPVSLAVPRSGLYRLAKLSHFMRISPLTLLRALRRVWLGCKTLRSSRPARLLTRSYCLWIRSSFKIIILFSALDMVLYDCAHRHVVSVLQSAQPTVRALFSSVMLGP